MYPFKSQRRQYFPLAAHDKLIINIIFYSIQIIRRAVKFGGWEDTPERKSSNYGIILCMDLMN